MPQCACYTCIPESDQRGKPPHASGPVVARSLKAAFPRSKGHDFLGLRMSVSRAMTLVSPSLERYEGGASDAQPTI